jgi:mannose-6-phosphate isomerase-like protein (cupin superfamily)
MIKKLAQQKEEIRENMRGGTGKVTFRHYLNKEEMKAKCRLCSQIIIAPGASIGVHEHINEDEIYIIQQGQGIINDNGKDVVVESGDAVLTGQGGMHSIKNIGATDLIFTAVIIEY